MTEDSINQRRRYVQEIRNSFGDNQPSSRSNRNHLQAEWEREEELEKVGSSVFWKVRIIFSILIFAAFVLCDQTGYKFFSLSTDTITTMIEKNMNTDSGGALIKQIQTYLNDKL